MRGAARNEWSHCPRVVPFACAAPFAGAGFLLEPGFLVVGRFGAVAFFFGAPAVDSVFAGDLPPSASAEGVASVDDAASALSWELSWMGARSSFSR